VNRNLLIGVDPGLSGAVAFYNFESKRLEGVHDMPLIKKANGKHEIDTFSLTQIIDRVWTRVELAVIEEVHSMPKQGVASTFTFGYAAGLIAGTISAFNIPVLKTPPAVWKSLCGLNANKDFSRASAITLFPEFEKNFSKKKDDGRAEAAILAKFGERFLSK